MKLVNLAVLVGIMVAILCSPMFACPYIQVGPHITVMSSNFSEWDLWAFGVEVEVECGNSTYYDVLNGLPAMGNLITIQGAKQCDTITLKMPSYGDICSDGMIDAMRRVRLRFNTDSFLMAGGVVHHISDTEIVIDACFSSEDSLAVDGILIEQVPEPATLALLGFGGFALRRKRA